MEPTNPLFSTFEIEMLRDALNAGEGRPVSEAEVKALLDWAGHVRLDAFLLDAVLDGDSDIYRRPDGRFASKLPLQQRLFGDADDDAV
jgi:hypothetical protein